ncbi:MAG: shikimate dehydrogenase [Pirellulaceae bacterium]|nr:shikimate dehydrogenase [Planctomycetales bacterium]MCA9223093.1 shikimate dehydrogenase [Planctomycetales bacterium]MCA9224821.1 shikimate dehydrogenase [Planctomycetales bacterium]
MICVSIGRGRHKQTKAEHRHLVEQGAKMVELRIDYINSSVNLTRLLRDRPCDVIITCRREQDGGKWTAPEATRQMLLRSAIASGVEYIDLEDDVAGSIPRYGATKRIVSLHNFRETPENLEEIHARLASLDADIVKIATMAHNPHDNVRMLRLIKNAKIPTVGMCMGDMGMPTRILAGKFGAPFTYATFHHERALAPGQLSYQQMTEIYNYENISERTEVFGVIADPIGHSLSPLVHNACFRELQMDKVYVPFRVPREDLETFLDDCAELGVRGLSVTIPHKESVMRYLTQVDDAAREIGAVNTVVWRDNERHGYNTDYLAALDSLTAALGRNTNIDTFSGRSALILGAGGVARAIGYGLIKHGCEVTFTARRSEQAKMLAASLGGKAVDWESRHSVKAGILVNGTPIGMHPNVDETPFEAKFLHRSSIVFDTVYNPEQTLLIKQARELNCRVVTGVEMFVRQAALQFKLFTGQEASTEIMRDQVKRAIGAARL